MVALLEKPAFSSFEKVLTCLEEWASYGHTSYWQAWEKLKLLSPSLSRISPFLRAGTSVTCEKTRLHEVCQEFLQTQQRRPESMPMIQAMTPWKGLKANL